MTDEIKKQYFTIGEVSALINEAPSLIRFWEKEFTQLKPAKTPKGTRKYNEKDIELIQQIHYLVKTKGYTLDGAKEALKNINKKEKKAEIIAQLTAIRNFLQQLQNNIQ